MQTRKSIWNVFCKDAMHRVLVVCGISILVLIVLFIIVFKKNIVVEKNDVVLNKSNVGTRFTVPAGRQVASQTPDEKINITPRHIDGILMPDESFNIRPVAVMVDNFIESRPFSGISKAQLVIEAPVEAGITRFLALYASAEDVQVGPVRSVRPYFVDWASEFGAVYAHVGGSVDGLRASSQSEFIIDADDIAGRAYFWRDPARVRPHNMYASTQELRAYAEALGFSAQKDIESWKYLSQEEFPKSQDLNPTEPFILFRAKENEVSWKYDSAKQEYIRYELGEKYLEADGSEIRAKNVIVAHMDMSVLDEMGRRKFETVGEGSADIFYLGLHFSDVLWKKNLQSSRMNFFKKNTSQEFPFIPGTTWIEIVPPWGVKWGIIDSLDKNTISP